MPAALKKKASLVSIAGKSDDFIEIGGIEFMMAALTMKEYIQYETLSANIRVEDQAEWLAAKLRARLRNPTRDDPALIDGEWVLTNVEMRLIPTLRYILLNGELPPADTETNSPKD